MNEQNPYLKKLLSEPLHFSNEDFEALISRYRQPNGQYNTETAFADMRYCIRKIYDLNENRLQEASNANQGTIGKLNKRSTKIRKKRYFKRISQQKEGDKKVRIYCEGDSWFLFPVFVKDVIDWLSQRKDYLIYSDAYGGDWITNIIYEGQYIEAISTHCPDVFLISGGGNDLVGNNRLAIMVNANQNQTPKYSQNNPLQDPTLSEKEKNMIMRAQPYITKEFYAFLLVMKIQYTLLFKNLYSNRSKHKNMISITQGYAYPYPKQGSDFSWRYPLQPLVNRFIDSGKWLFRPLMIKGIINPELQQSIVGTFLYEFNALLMDLANSPEFPNLYHIDCRSVATKPTDWHDELHLKSHVYKKVALLFEKTIDHRHENLPKIIRPE
jgi:hypothetical protein